MRKREISYFWIGVTCGVALSAAGALVILSVRKHRAGRGKVKEPPQFQILTRSDGAPTSETLTRWGSLVYNDYRRHGDDEPKAVFRLVCELIHRGCTDVQVQSVVTDVIEGRNAQQWDNGRLSDLIEDARRLESLMDESSPAERGGNGQASSVGL